MKLSYADANWRDKLSVNVCVCKYMHAESYYDNQLLIFLLISIWFANFNRKCWQENHYAIASTGLGHVPLICEIYGKKFPMKITILCQALIGLYLMSIGQNNFLTITSPFSYYQATTV